MKKLLLFTAMSVVTGWATAQTYTGRSFPTPEQRLNDQYASGVFKTTDGSIFNIASDPSANSYLNILDYLQGRVAGLQIYHQRDGSSIPVIRNQRASIFINELPVSARDLSMLASSDIAMIKVIKGAFVGAYGNGGGGVIAIYTMKGDGEDEEDEG
jgi:hypothetical protein